MNRLLKIFLYISVFAISLIIVGLFFFNIITKDAILDTSKLINIENSIIVCDSNGETISNTSIDTKNRSVELEELNKYTIDAFIASEDRLFYSHNGLNYGRMAKALFKNLFSGSFKQGASTISQQLIKNTHLSSEKTISRKLKEIKLTTMLEKKYSKNQILEMYLNSIYFGHNCYGLENASCFYFDKQAKDLTLNESATLVGLLSSPNNYSPLKNPKKSLQRRNLVLKAMLKTGKISNDEYNREINLPLQIPNNKTIANNDYLANVINELDELNIDFYKLNGAKIITYMSKRDQNSLDSLTFNSDYSIIITNNDGGVSAYRSNVGNIKRQPASTIKPILVYAPAIEEKIISTYDKIFDEKINYSGYSPTNHDNKFRGQVSVLDSIKYSLNIPAVKTLNMLGIDKAYAFAKELNIDLDEKDNNLSLALGGLTYGTTLKQICDAYSTFARDGYFAKSAYIFEVIDKTGNVIYKHQPSNNKVFSSSTCSLINEALIETVKDGTAKKIGKRTYDVAAKTGTLGNKNGNTDAYCISYTTDKCIGVWLGDKNNHKVKITSGTNCCEITAQILDRIYDDKSDKLNVDKDLQTIEIDKDEYKNGKIVIADDCAPRLNKIKIKRQTNGLNYPKSTKFSKPSIEKPKIYTKNHTVIIELCQTEYYSIVINRRFKNNKEQIYDGKWITKYTDRPQKGDYVYSLIPYYYDGKTKHYGDEIYLDKISLTSNEEYYIPKISNDKWYE